MEAEMQRQMTITVDETVYEALCAKAEQRTIADFLADMVRNQETSPLSQTSPYQKYKCTYTEAELEAGYRAMAADEEYERNAKVWINGLMESPCDDQG
jgi:ribosomal protein S17